MERTMRRYARIGTGIIERGSNSNGSYIKFGDGTLICYGTSGNILVDTAYGAGFFSGNAYFQATFPCAFISNPKFYGTPIQTLGAWYWLSATGSAGLLNGPPVRAFGFANGYTCQCEWLAVGRWKA